MSNGPHIEIIGDEALLRALTDAPDVIDAAIDLAGDEAASVLQRAISAVTPVRTGFLRSQNDLIPVSNFTVYYNNFAPYASYVDARRDFVARGVERGERQVDRVYQEAIDHAATEIEGQP
jgi:hypothetical protein